MHHLVALRRLIDDGIDGQSRKLTIEEEEEEEDGYGFDEYDLHYLTTDELKMPQKTEGMDMEARRTHVAKYLKDGTF